MSESGMSGQHAMVSQRVKPWRGHRRTQTRYQIQGLENEGAGPITPRALERELDAAILQPLKPLFGQDWPRDVADETFHTWAIAPVNHHLCVQVDTPHFGDRLIRQIALSLFAPVATRRRL